MKPQLPVLPLLLTLAACSTTMPHAAESPFLRNVRQINGDGSVAQIDARQLSVFQGFMRARLSAGNAPGRGGWELAQAPAKSGWDLFGGKRPPVVVQVLTLEVDRPEGEGTEGAYAAVVLFGDAKGVQRAEFQYYEQANHAPRYDRYFHRMLTGQEQTALLAFLKAHPPETLHPLPNAPAATSQAATAEEPGLEFRFTTATAKEATAVVMPDPIEADQPGMELLRLFAGFRDADAPPLVCSYLRAIPVNAMILFAHPQHWATALWDQGGELRVQIDPPLKAQRPATEATIPVEGVPPPEAPQWYAWQDGQWVLAADPTASADDAATNAAVPAAARPATRPAQRVSAVPGMPPVFPRLPRRPSTKELLAQMETRPEPLPAREQWRAQPRSGHTVFTHYVPLMGDKRIAQGESQEMIIPGLEFDSEHMAMDRTRQLLYVIHDGQVIAMPLLGVAKSR